MDSNCSGVATVTPSVCAAATMARACQWRRWWISFMLTCRPWAAGAGIRPVWSSGCGG